MDEIVPLQLINNNFQISIKKLTEINRSNNAIYYNAITVYGTMCLVIENYSDIIFDQSSIQFLNKRNNLMKKHSIFFPVVYEQQICVNHP